MKTLTSIICFVFVIQAQAQRYSFVTDISVMRNLSPQQQFWSIGQDFQANFNLSKKETVYLGFTYYREGRFTNRINVQAKSASTTPQVIQYTVTGGWKMRQVSIGWKHYFFGSFDSEDSWNLYGGIGFGLMYARADNGYNAPIDTALYQTPSIAFPGVGHFNRLTLDLSLGYEYPLGGNFFVYAEGKTWLPASSYPSSYLHSNRKVPFSVMGNLGIRILFGY